MPTNRARPSLTKDLHVDKAKAKVVELLRAGAKVAPAMAAVQRTEETYKDWRKTDPNFKEQVDLLRLISSRARADGLSSNPVPDFPEFADVYLKQPLFAHQLRQWDALNGRVPRDMHPSMVYREGRPTRFLFNMPPNHAKSTTWTMNYVTWRIVKDPDIRVIIVSKTRGMAQKFLGGIKARLTNPRYRELQAAFAPEGGWKDSESSWTATEIYVRGKGDGEKDPTVQALGVGGQIYGARADLIILDDVQDLGNAPATDAHLDWLGQEVATRPDDSGIIMVVATRVAPIDLSMRLRDDQYDDSGFDDESEDAAPSAPTPVWTYLAQPAVLEYSERPKDWLTLWPEMFPGKALVRKRADLRTAQRFALVYQQEDVADDATFPAGAVACSVNKTRAQGVMNPDAPGHREAGMRGLTVIGGVDPATVGHTAMIVYGVERATGKRWVLDGWNEAGASPLTIRNKLRFFTEKYRVSEWIVERNAFQAYLSRDEELLRSLYELGSRITEHYTTGNKHDPDFGVAAMAPLFLSCGTENDSGSWERIKGGGLIDLPNPRLARFVEQLMTQLILWQPGALKQGQKTDLVMALWFPLDVATPLWTDSGWQTMGSVSVGDMVATASGEMARVAALTAVRHEPVFRVAMSDGSSLRATASHRWWVSPVSVGSLTLPARWMSTDELRDGGGFKRLTILNPEPIDGPDVELPVDPYVLGVWLGDGDAAQGTIFGHDSDTRFVRGRFEMAGYETTDQRRGMCFGTHGLRGHLAAAGVLRNKHVPGVYLHGSAKQRLALLRGLMDTDGTVLPGRARAYFANTNKHLVDAVRHLALSLGFRVNVQAYPAGRNATPGGRVSDTRSYWRVLFTADSGTLNPFLLPRKADRVEGFMNSKPRRRLVVKSVVPDGTADTRCIAVDHPSHVFLAGADLVPTGNCEIAALKMLGHNRRRPNHLSSEFASRSDVRSRTVVKLSDVRAQMLESA